MIEDKTKVNENVEFDDGKELTDHLVAQGSVGSNDKEQVLIGHQYWEYGQEIWDTRVLGIVWGKLSPNPNGSGYVRQVIVPEGETVDDPQEDILYLVSGLKFKYLYAPIVDPNTNETLVPAGWVRVDNLPNLYLKKGERGTPVKENQPPRKRPHVFNEPVAFQDDILFKGKNLKNVSGFYRHFFYLIVLESQHGVTGLGTIAIACSYMANSPEAWATLNDIDGFIVSAFGKHETNAYIYELKLYDSGNCLIQITTVADGTVKNIVVPNMASFVLEDSVTAV